MSAIPWVGQDIVESKNIIEYFALPTIGSVNKNALKKGNKSIKRETDKQEYINLPLSFIAFLVGVIDGDGYIQISKTTKGFIAIKLIISLHLNDLSSLQYIQQVLCLGKITIYKDLRSPTCKLVINKTDLQEVLFPLFKHHKIFFLTETRISQFNTCMYILSNSILNFDMIPVKKDNLTVFKLPSTALGYTQLHFFRNWIVGFTMSEGSFLVKSNNDACFQLKQRIHVNLFEAFKLVFLTERKVSIEKGLYSQFSVTSKIDIQTVINFFSYSGLHPLLGLKNIQYLKWLSVLSNTIRYKNLNFPG